jgi:hypothetical protein
VRGLLCNVCNQAIAWVERHPQRVHMWINYLRRVTK